MFASGNALHVLVAFLYILMGVTIAFLFCYEVGKHMGKRKRPVHGSCPGCGATERYWCAPACGYIDPLDTR